jgi:hypothetical protein
VDLVDAEEPFQEVPLQSFVQHRHLPYATALQSVRVMTWSQRCFAQRVHFRRPVDRLI